MLAFLGEHQLTVRRAQTTAADPAAVGVAVGLALPETQPEHRLMGEARDNLLERAASTAKETVEKVQHVATEATRAAGNEARTQGITA